MQPSGGTFAGLVTTTVALERGSVSDAAAPPLGPALSPGTQVGRYRVVELLGTGGGGSVYRAHDPHLSRDIALKVLHRRDELQTSDREYRRRLLREAKTLAKLSHPNVVAAYDVGTFGDSVFVAMELVPGESLRVWLQREKHSREEILRVLIAIGRGLIAAHAAGVTHRDIKPANVMVAPDGSVRIVDFGLARSVRSPAEANEPAVTVGDRAATFAALTSEMTDTALLSGTPGYIAPEILCGDVVIDAHADQFSYAVTVFLALTGKRPYEGNTLSEYMAALTHNERAPWPRTIPRRIRRVVERGLQCRHEDRYPSVRVFVDALEKASAPSRRAPAFAAVGLGALALAASALVIRERATRETCRGDAAAFAGVWDAERRAALERALNASGRFNAAEAFGLLAARLDSFERNWLVMKQDSCQATHVRGEQSERVLALRNGCLARKLEGVKALVQAFSEPDPQAPDRAAGATPDPLDECADTATLLGLADKLPADPEVQKAIGEVESRMVVTRALMTAGRNAAIDHGRQVLESARRIGHEPTLAQAVSSLAHAISVSASSAEEHKQGEEMLRESMRLAAKVGDDRMLAKTAAHLFVVLAYGQRRVQEADAMLPMVEALVSLTGNDREQRLEVLMGRGMILSQRRKYREATEVFDQVILLSASVESDRRGYGAYANGEIGRMDLDNHRYPEAVRRFEAELAGIRKELGARHPRVVFSLVNLALAQSKAGLRDAAWASVAQIRDLVSHLYPPGDWRYVAISFVEGNIWEDAGDCPRALPAYREAYRTIEATYGPSHSNTADVRARLGTCLHALGQLGEATGHLERVLEIRTEIGAAPNVIAEAAFQLADVFWLGSSTQRSRALALAEQALSLWRQDQVSDRVREAEEWLARRRPSATTSAGRKTSPVAHQSR